MSERGTVRPRPLPQADRAPAPRARHAIVEASAGTGKTYVLEHLIVDLLLRTGTTLDQILVVTFTEKATAELTHRVRRKLEELSETCAPSRPRRCVAIPPDRRRPVGAARTTAGSSTGRRASACGARCSASTAPTS